MKKNIGRALAFMIPLSGVIVLIGETILRQELLGGIRWMMTSPIHFGLNWLMLLMLLMTCSSLFDKLWKGLGLVALIYMIGCIVSFYKFKISGEYLIPADLLLIGEATSISKEMNITIERNIVIGIVVGLLVVIGVYKLDKVVWSRRQRKVIGGIGSVLICITIGIGVMTFYETKSVEPVLQVIGEETVNQEYDEKGFLVGFTEEISELVVARPEQYSKEKVKKILEGYTNSEEEEFVKPNIIMIMSESFFDLNELPEVVFSENPIKNFEKYQEEYVKGKIITAVYGGRTCQTEYEVLTGHSVDFTGEDNIAYMRFVKEDTPSIPKLLKQEGYKTVAIHTYEREFFSRDVAYQNLGIEEFWASESFENPRTVRGYISDYEMTEKIIEAYKTKVGEEPLFVHAVTMQNHMPYDEPYEANQIKVDSQGLTDIEKQALTTYANGVNDSDQALKQLINYFSKVEEPTVIVMYGDHLPDLSKDYGVYKNSEYIRGTLGAKERFQLHQTPFVIWNNYQLAKEDWGYIDASYLGSQLLDYIGYNKDPYMNFLDEAIKTVRAYHTAFVIDGKGTLRSKENLGQDIRDTLDKMWMIQYDRLFGEEEVTD
ncbi:MAG: LTA synthase family protein [Cellulosilyticaceae bacterium]